MDIMNYIEKVREFIVEELLLGEDSELTDETSFYETNIIDSLGIIRLISFLEETFNLEIEDEELVPENLDNLKNIASFLERKLNGESP